MCGIAGIIGTIEGREALMQKMLNAQKHRGPDANGSWQNGRIIVGHNRLSIIDLSADANQPMHSNCGKYSIVFNGEIYNYIELKNELRAEYAFRTESDTEVLLAAFIKWGKKMLERLNGMFAFGIVDHNHNSFFGARDRFGVKPFHFTLYKGCYYFASEIKTLWAAGLPKKWNLPVWSKYFSYGTYGMPGETFWENIKQLPAGHFVEIDIAQEKEITEPDIVQHQWYDFKSRIEKTPPIALEELKEEYGSLLRNAVKLRFRSDVPVGFNISGGLDSSALLALVNQAFPDNGAIEAFTFYTGNKDYDELPWVESMIQRTGNPLNKCLLKSEAVAELLNKVSFQQDEPFGGFATLAYSLLFKAARDKGIIVLLDGQGMDEAWAGYDYYQTKTGHNIQGTYSSPFRPEVLQNNFGDLAVKDIFPTPFDNDLQNLQYRDLFYTKLPRALRFNDRISMMHSTELREPFLDYRLLELAFAQPAELKIKNGQGKWLLREIVKELIGEGLALAPKRPLQTPQREWISRDLSSLFNQRVTSFSDLNFTKKKEVLKNWNSYLSGDQENSFYIWQWVNSLNFTNQDEILFK